MDLMTQKFKVERGEVGTLHIILIYSSWAGQIVFFRCEKFYERVTRVDCCEMQRESKGQNLVLNV